MAKSLQDQLLALGLAKDSPAAGQGKNKRDSATGAKQKQQTRAKAKQTGPAGSEKNRTGSELSLEQAYMLREKQAKELALQARERKKLEDLRRRQINEAIRVIVEPNRLNDPAADISRNFMYKGRIRKVNVTAGQLKALNEGTLGLVYLAGGYHIMAPEHVGEVQVLSPEHVPDLSGGEDQDEDEYPVPDDLVW